MTDTVAKLRVGSKHFEVVVDMDQALKIRKGESDDVGSTLSMNNIFHNSKTNETAGQSELQEAFGSTDLLEVAERIIKKGELNVTQEHRDSEREQKKKKVVDWFVRNVVDSRSGRPFTPDAISSALDQAGARIDNKPAEQQIKTITEDLKKVIPIKIETKKIIITIPAIYTGKAYGILNEYKEKEDWLGNGDLKAVINIPIGLQMDFYDKLNAITHGAALSEEVKQDKLS